MNGQLRKNYVHIKNNPLFNKSYIISLVKIKILQTIQNIETNNRPSNKMKRKKVQQCQNNSKISYHSLRKRQNHSPLHTNIWPLTFLAWYRHFTKKWRGLTSFKSLKSFKSKTNMCLYLTVELIVEICLLALLFYFTDCLLLYQVNMWYTYLYFVINWL